MIRQQLRRRTFVPLMFGAAAFSCFGRTASADASSISVAVLDAASKLLGPTPPPNDPAASVSLMAARNEAETAQLVVWTSDTTELTAAIQVSALSGAGGEIPASQVDLFKVHYISVTHPSDSSARSGHWPDALIPLNEPVTLGAGAATVIWLRVWVADTVPAGTYSGTISIDAGRAGRRTVPISIRVFAVTLPKPATLPFLTALDYESIHRLDGSGMAPDRFARVVLPAYYQALRTAGAGPFALFGGMPSVTGVGASLTADFSGFDQALLQAYDDPRQFPIPVPFDLTHTPWPAEQWAESAITYLRQAAAHLDRMGSLDRSYLYVREADEPTRQAQVDKIVMFQKLVTAADPRLRILQTVHARCFDCSRDIFDQLDSKVTLWTPNIAYADGVAVGVDRLGRITSFDSQWSTNVKRRKTGADSPFWWYLNAASQILPAPQTPYPSLYIDHDGMSQRALAWSAWTKNVAAIGHWSATWWRNPVGPWRQVPRGEGDGGTNGDGVLLYPRNDAAAATGQGDPGGPCTSIRLELIREGGEDHKLLNFAEEAIGREAAMRIATTVAPSLRSPARDPTILRLARQSLLEAVSV